VRHQGRRINFSDDPDATEKEDFLTRGKGCGIDRGDFETQGFEKGKTDDGAFGGIN